MARIGDIYEDFLNSDITYLQAIELLEATGLDPKEAEQIVADWHEELACGMDD